MSHHTDACRMHPKSKMMSHHKDACRMMRYLMMHRGKSMMMRVCPSTVLLPRTSHSTPPIDSHVSDPTQSFDVIAPVRVGEARGCDPDYIYSYQAVDEGIEVPTQAGLQANPGVRCWKAHVEANRFEAAGGSDTTLNCWEQIESHIGPGTAGHWDFLNQASCDEVCPDVCSPTSLIVHPVPDIIEQCCAPLRAGTDPATVHCNDDVMLYHASWEIHDDNQPSWESHGGEQSLWENHDDDQSVWEILLLDIVLSLVLLFVQSQHHVTTMLMPPNSAALPCALVVTQLLDGIMLHIAEEPEDDSEDASCDDSNNDEVDETQCDDTKHENLASRDHSPFASTYAAYNIQCRLSCTQSYFAFVRPKSSFM